MRRCLLMTVVLMTGCAAPRPAPASYAECLEQAIDDATNCHVAVGIGRAGASVTEGMTGVKPDRSAFSAQDAQCDTRYVARVDLCKARFGKEAN